MSDADRPVPTDDDELLDEDDNDDAITLEVHDSYLGAN